MPVTSEFLSEQEVQRLLFSAFGAAHDLDCCSTLDDELNGTTGIMMLQELNCINHVQLLTACPEAGCRGEAGRLVAGADKHASRYAYECRRCGCKWNQTRPCYLKPGDDRAIYLKAVVKNESRSRRTAVAKKKKRIKVFFVLLPLQKNQNMSTLLNRIGVPHTVHNESSNLTRLLAAHFDLQPKWSVGETQDDTFASVADYIEECQILVINDITMSIQLYGTRRLMHRRSAVVCIRSHDDYAILTIRYRLHQMCIAFSCRSFQAVYPTRAAIRCYLVTFGLAFGGSFLTSAALAVRASRWF